MALVINTSIITFLIKGYFKATLGSDSGKITEFTSG